MHHRYWDTDLTNAYIPRTTKYLAIACQIRAIGHDTEICNIGEFSMRSVNHWIGGARKSDSEPCSHPGLRINSSAAVALFQAYNDKGVRLLQTVADGDCGIDMCTMILEWERTAASRQKVRDKLCEVAINSMNNRAFVFLMYTTGEIKHHMGCHGLDDSFVALLEQHGHRAYFAGHQSDGVGVVEADQRGSGVVAMSQPVDCTASEVTDEEVAALTWKCSLHKMSARMIKDLASRLADGRSSAR